MNLWPAAAARSSSTSFWKTVYLFMCDTLLLSYPVEIPSQAPALDWPKQSKPKCIVFYPAKIVLFISRLFLALIERNQQPKFGAPGQLLVCYNCLVESYHCPLKTKPPALSRTSVSSISRPLRKRKRSEAAGRGGNSAPTLVFWVRVSGMTQPGAHHRPTDCLSPQFECIQTLHNEGSRVCRRISAAIQTNDLLHKLGLCLCCLTYPLFHLYQLPLQPVLSQYRDELMPFWEIGMKTKMVWKENLLFMSPHE